jgi:hybrid cluster-associated redox disulfide protein
MSKITRASTLQEAIKTGPHAVATLAAYRMGCAACSGKMYETVEWGAMTHGVDVEELLARLNEKNGGKERGGS